MYRFDKTQEFILPLIGELSMDSEPAVKQHLVEQMKLLAYVCAYFYIKDDSYVSHIMIMPGYV
jgi:hypothetical protein